MEVEIRCVTTAGRAFPDEGRALNHLQIVGELPVNLSRCTSPTSDLADTRSVRGHRLN